MLGSCKGRNNIVGNQYAASMQRHMFKTTFFIIFVTEVPSQKHRAFWGVSYLYVIFPISTKTKSYNLNVSNDLKWYQFVVNISQMKWMN